MYGSGAVSCSCSLLIRGPNLARCQAEAPLIALCKFPKPALMLRLLVAVPLKVDSTRPSNEARAAGSGRIAHESGFESALKPLVQDPLKCPHPLRRICRTS